MAPTIVPDKPLSVQPQDHLDVWRASRQRIGHQKGPYVRWMDEGEDDTQLVLPKWDMSNGKPTMARTLNNWKSGICCLLGQPNAGKSTLLIQMITDSLRLNDDLIVIDLSLDDPLEKRQVQYLANLTGLHYAQIYDQSSLGPAQKDLLEQADKQLEEWIASGRLRPYQAKVKIPGGKVRAGGIQEDRVFNTRHYKTLINLMRKLRQENPENKIVVVVDAWNNLDYSGLHGSSDLNQMNLMLDILQEEADSVGVNLLVSAHARKTMHGKKLSAEDIKGTKNMEYNAVAILIVRNEYRENQLTEPLMYEDGDKEYPILTVEIAKTKVSSWDMPLFYILKAGQCQVKSLDTFEYEATRDVYTGKRK